MAITAIDKIKINKYLKDHSIDDIYYLDLCDYLGKRGKISDIEFLEYFTDCVVNEFRKNEKISLKHIAKIMSIIDAFLCWMHESNSKIQEEVLDKIRNFKDFYLDYQSRNNLKIDTEFVNNDIEAVLKTINDLYPCKIENESISKYINKIEELNEYIKTLQRELNEVNNLYNNLHIEYNKKSDKLENINKEINSFENDIRNKIKEISSLQETIATLNEKIKLLEKMLAKSQEENQKLEQYKVQFEHLKDEVNNLTKKIQDDIIKKENEVKLRIKQLEIESLIYQKILLNESNINEILKYVKDNGLITDRNEIIELLRRMKSKINIQNNSFSQLPTYRITSPAISSNGQFSIDILNKYFDIMLVSDFHIRDFNYEVLNGFDMLNDYCIKNNINLILNLGDFYQGLGNLDYDNATRNYKIIEQSISLIPKVDGVYHAILGGNHDKSITKYGFDPLEILSNERNDIINLGYTHSTIVLKKTNKILGKIDLHHPDTFDFPIDLDHNGIDLTYLNNYLNRIYNNQNRNREDAYIDLFGHTHKSQLNIANSYYFIPPFFESSSRRGACHLRVYLDEDNKIKYMVFMPLSITDKMFKNNEIIYQKKYK